MFCCIIIMFVMHNIVYETMEILPGVYETLISQAIEERLHDYMQSDFYIQKEDIDSAESYKMLSDYLAEVVSGILKSYFRDKDNKKTIANQVEVVNRILRFIEEEWRDQDIETERDQLSEASRLQFLRGIYSKVGYTDLQLEEKAKNHPVSGYRVSNLFTGGNDLSMDDEIRRDIQTADQIDLIVSFIKFQGLRLLYDELEEFVRRGDTRLRVLTTTYMGATDPKAIRVLYELRKFGRVEIKASFNTKQERLHAKSYIFSRNNSFDTAYIGSSNMSRSALTKGLEWNLRVTSVENRHIIHKTQATFDNYWNSDDFESIDSEEALQRFAEAIWRERRQEPVNEGTQEYVTRFERKTHQIKVLEKLQYEREQGNHYKNLIIAATGTGKTAISAFDFKDFNKKLIKEEGRRARLLFIVHREKILKQARSTFRSVLVDGNFGEIWTGRIMPSCRGNLEHLFITIQTLNNNWDTIDRMGKDYYDYVVIDEVHHSAAGSYREIFEHLKPRILVGLTATPERMDGKEIKGDFDNRFAAEIRLQEALDQQLLAPFDYFCVTDKSVDLSRIACRGDVYDRASLNQAYLSNLKERFGIIQHALERYLTDPKDCKAVCFCCSIEHAEHMARMFRENGYRAQSVTSRNSFELDTFSGQLARGEINYLCVADILNEGIDIPEIDTVLFLRPTESLTVFLQQLGRGLRLADGKTCLTVLDFVAQANQNYNYESRFRALVGRTTRSVTQEIKNGFTFLPRGCSITMEKQAQEYILTNIKEAIFNLSRLRREVKSFTQNTGRDLTLGNFLDNFNLDWRHIYKTPGSWARLKQQAGLAVNGFDEQSKYVKLLEGGLTRLYHTNSHDYLTFLLKLMQQKMVLWADASVRERKFFNLFYNTVWLDHVEKVNKSYGLQADCPEQLVAEAFALPWFREELEFLVEHRLSQLCKTTKWIQIDDEAEIELYGCYSADEIHLLLENKLGRWQVLGTQYNMERKFAMVFVTLNKSDKQYSPSTLYEDYAISQQLFHWQSMNKVRVTSNEGQRIVNQAKNGWKFILFVRDAKTDEYNNTNGYYCLGLMDFKSSHGECPMNVVWQMQNDIPGFILESAKAV